MSKHDLTHARHDPAHCLAPGLFHRHQHAAVSALIPLVKRGSVVVLLAHAEAHEEAAPV
ncbi:replication protein C, IncQ-type, partial [Aeromonas caviae]|uniref:replication protein C, IncQ-type n=1 Tax=Aeromonas caviae TaxID=648 RepID=UPI004039A4F3